LLSLAVASRALIQSLAEPGIRGRRLAYDRGRRPGSAERLADILVEVLDHAGHRHLFTHGSIVRRLKRYSRLEQLEFHTLNGALNLLDASSYGHVDSCGRRHPVGRSIELRDVL